MIGFYQRVTLVPLLTLVPLVTLVPLLCAISGTVRAAPEKAFHLPEKAAAVLASHCFDCHDADTQKGEVRLDQLASLPLDQRLDLLNRVQEAVHFGEMPPKKRKRQSQPNALPDDTERQTLLDWAAGELNRHHADKLADKLRQPAFGNVVDHDKLFSGEHRHLKGFTPDRRWLISEFIFDAKMNRILNHQPTRNIDGKRRSVVGDNKRRVNLTNPFLLPSGSGVRYYDTTTLNGGHLLTMLTNAKEASTYMLYLSKRDRRYLPAVEELMRREWEQQRILETRTAFLTQHVEALLLEIYGAEKHAALLPAFEPVEVAPIVETGNKKSPFHAANPGQKELVLIYHSMRRHQAEGQSDDALIRACEQEWFFHGHNPRTIQTRLTFLAGYLEEFRQQIVQHRYAQKHKVKEYRAPEGEEAEAYRDAILRHRKPGDRYAQIIDKCLADWQKAFAEERNAAGPPDDAKLNALVGQLFGKLFEREPTAEESDKYRVLTRSYLQQLGTQPAIEKLIQTLMLRSEFVYRAEFGTGEPDEHGRRMLSPRDASYALAYALTDSSPDPQLAAAARDGTLGTRADYQREIKRMLANREQYYIIEEGVERLQLTASFTAIPIRELRFFREFFGYPNLLPIFKDNKRFGSNYDNAKGRLVGEADRLVDHILERDRDVFEELLTTDEFYVYHSGDNAAMAKSSERIREIYDYFKEHDWENFTAEDLAAHTNFIAKVKMRGIDVKRLNKDRRYDPIRSFKTAMTSFTARFDKGQTAAAPFVSFPAHGLYNASTRTGLQLRSPEVARFFNIKLDEWNYPAEQPAPVAHRKGMLTHPAWLIAHARNTETDPVHRGKWVREKLLAGTVPDLPITVDAVIPEDHHRTLRERLAGATEQEYCWKCHERMNPLGYAFEMYDDFGRYRTEESLEHPDNLIKKSPDKGGTYADLRDIYKTLPVNPKGRLDGTGDAELDGEVADAIDLSERLARSDRVRQSIIRHAFRYFLGRNEVLSDSETLLDAEQAYLDSGGSFDAVILSLLSSDSFIFRKAPETTQDKTQVPDE